VKHVLILMMDFTPTPTQQAVTDLAAQILADAKPDPWKELAQAGLLALAVPETAALLTEIGRRAVPLPALPTLTSALAIARWGSTDLQEQLLPPVAVGELLLTAAIREPGDPFPETPATTVTGNTITGTKIGVPYANDSALLLIPARLTTSVIVGSFGSHTTETVHDHDVQVVVVAPGAAGVHLTRTFSSSGQPEYTVRLEGAPVVGVLGPAACARDLYQLAVVGACALADGALAGALALTRDHVASREQFGRPLAAFQAVSQQIADVYIASRTLHLATTSACWRLAEDRDPADDIEVAGYWCAEQAPRSVRICHHLHGGTGMDVSYPLHRHSALISDLVRFLGGAAYRLERRACSST
jgi:3-oxo-4-pregnene-20-carboxyl-CoA dehydrogenase alpha subunit